MDSIDQVKIETKAHQEEVMQVIEKLIEMLKSRGRYHDASKLLSPEIEIFAEYTPKLKTLQYDSDEYTKSLEEMGVAIEHHYAKNRHHAQHFENGINDMNLIDVIEMLADWIAATKRTKNGNIHQSMKLNKEKYKIDDQLYSIMKNTIQLFEI